MANFRLDKEWWKLGKIGRPRFVNEKAITAGNEGGFKKYKIQEVLEWQPQKEIDPLKIPSLTKNGKKYPFYGQSTLNNGIISYESLREDVLNNAEGKPTILIHSNNQNTVYLESPFYLKDGNGATSVLQSNSLNEISALYFITTIKKAISNLSYQEKATKIVLKNTFISLPTNKTGELDFEYMENYIQIILNNNLQIMDSFVKKNKLSSLSFTVNEKNAVDAFNNGLIVNKDFKISKLFNIYSPPKRFNANAIEFGGKFPYVARGSENNGIRGFTTQDIQYLSKGNTISFGQDTATIYYQEKPYFTGDKIKVMELTDSELNENKAIYIISAMRKSFSTFAWGSSSFNEDILNNVIIKLPVTKSGDIDYEFMENYISAQKKLAVLPILDNQNSEYHYSPDFGVLEVAEEKEYKWILVDL